MCICVCVCGEQGRRNYCGSRHLRARGYNMFLFQGSANEPKVAEQKNTRDVSRSCFILPEHHIDHRFSFSSLSSLFIRPPRALSRLVAVYFPPVCSRWRASWCSALLNQQHIKVKSPGEKKNGFLLRYPYLITWLSRL